MKISVSILGSCISRDALAFHNDENFTVEKCLFGCSPVYFATAPFSQGQTWYEDGIFSDETNFLRRCQRLQATGMVMDFFNQKISDYLIIDFNSISCPLIKVVKDTETHYIVANSVIMKKLPVLLKKLRSMGYVCELISSCSFTDDDWSYFISSLAKNIRELYSDDKIIINAGLASALYEDATHICAFSPDNVNALMLSNKLIAKCYALLQKEFPNAHFIKMPRNTLASSKHKWGLSDWHFASEYYDYVYTTLNVIVQKNSNEKELLEKLYEQYNDLFQEKLTRLIMSTINKPVSGDFSLVLRHEIVDNKIKLIWSPVSNIDNYRIQRYNRDIKVWSTIFYPNKDATSYIDNIDVSQYEGTLKYKIFCCIKNELKGCSNIIEA